MALQERAGELVGRAGLLPDRGRQRLTGRMDQIETSVKVVPVVGLEAAQQTRRPMGTGTTQRATVAAGLAVLKTIQAETVWTVLQAFLGKESNKWLKRTA